MNTFELQILTPERPFYWGPCVSLTVPISDGMLGIMAGHEPLTAAIRDGEVHFTLPDGTVRTCAVTRGLLDVSAENVRLISESALAPEEIDEELEKRALEEATIQLREKQARRDYIQAQLAFARAMNNLKVKQHDAERMNK
ncbi:MAG: ATP synthase F1 subunit epsilon [Lachnospiraceae bacterium]|nr:ATP synthase F1 subunit epsilon [Lachnospiraceae bacterium]